MVKKIYWLKYKGSKSTHRVPANSIEEAKGKMLKGTKWLYSDIIAGKKQGR